MSSSQDSQTNLAAIKKAQEGERLLAAGDYQGAIAACTEAIELVPTLLRPKETRAEAYRRLAPRKFRVYLSPPDLSPQDFDERLIRRLFRMHKSESPFVEVSVTSSDILVNGAQAIPLSRIISCTYEYPGPTLLDSYRSCLNLRYWAEDGTSQTLRLWMWSDYQQVKDDRKELYTQISNEYQAHQWREQQPPTATFLTGPDPSAFLRDLGVAARLEDWSECDGGRESMCRWLIDLADGLISKVALQHLSWMVDGGPDALDYWESSLTVELLVPDPRIRPDFPQVKLRSVMVRSFPVFGKVTGVHWEDDQRQRKDLVTQPFGHVEGTEGLASEIISRLSEDSSIEAVVVEGKWDLTIDADPARCCWVITTKDGEAAFSWYPSVALTRRQWDCYQDIAQALLAMPMPTSE